MSGFEDNPKGRISNDIVVPPGVALPQLSVPSINRSHPSKPTAGSLGTPLLGYDHMALQAKFSSRASLFQRFLWLLTSNKNSHYRFCQALARIMLECKVMDSD